MIRIAYFAQRKAEIKNRAINALRSVDMNVDIPYNESETIKLVFAGQYSAGKSSILKMLTGREDIEIGPGITTQSTHKYDWNGIEVIDTPGIHTELRPDHDEISYGAIASADMLVFVVTNELFDSYIAEHFRKLAIDKDKAGEMILVVNKMNRTAIGNSPEQQNIIREDLRKVLEPYTPEQLNLSFLDAESYLKGIKEMDPEIANEYISSSGFDEFVNTLNRFIEEKSISSKLTTELYLLDDYIEKGIKLLEPKSSDMSIDALEENLMQQRHILIEARNRVQQDIKDVYTIAASQIRDIGLDAANLLYEGCKQEEVEEELNKSIRKANDLIDKSQNDAEVLLSSRLNEIGQELENLEESDFSNEIKLSLEGKFEGLPEGVKKFVSNVPPQLQKAGQAIMKNAYKPGVAGGMKLTCFSGGKIHEMVKNIGHGIGFKFKPWQALKIAKGIAIGGQVLNVLGVGLSVFMQIKADRDEDKMREDLKKNRQNIRSQFNAAASELEDYARQFIQEYIVQPLESSIATIDSNIQEIRNTRDNRSAVCRELEELQRENRLLIQEIHSKNRMV